MMNNKRSYTRALIAICLLLVAFTSCSETNEVADYLDETYDIIADSTEASMELDLLIAKIQLGIVSSNSTVVQLDNLEATYQELLTEFEKIPPPEECIKFSDYFADYLTLAETPIQDLQDYFRFGNEHDLNTAEAEYISTNNVRTLAYNEWDRLKRELPKDDDVKSPWF